MTPLRLSLRVVLALLLVPAAHAGGKENGASPSGATASAAAHFQRGGAHYAARAFEAAILEFQAAYDLEPRREYLFAWAQAERLSGDCVSALVLYDRFLATHPPGRQEGAAQENRALCVEALATRPPRTSASAVTEGTPERPASAQPPAAEAPLPKPTPLPIGSSAERSGSPALRASAISLVVVGAAALVAGGVLEGLARAANDQIDHPALGWIFDPSVETRRDAFQAAAIPLLAIGGAAVGAGAIVGVVAIRRARNRHGRERVSAADGPDGRRAEMAGTLSWPIVPAPFAAPQLGAGRPRSQACIGWPGPAR
jgi:hypothetical protein